MRSRVFAAFLVVSLSAPIAACANFKPLRVLAPEWMGLTCSEQGVCVDDQKLFPQATALKLDAVNFIEQRVGKLTSVPRVLYCFTVGCAQSFGFTEQGAYTVGASGIVVGPRGWHAHFIRHELIHHLQVERWGSLRTWLYKPDWLVEGMAYSLSDDPRHPLPAPLEGWRQQFEVWHHQLTGSMWLAADTQ